MLDCFGSGKNWNARWQISRNHRRFSLRCLSADIIPTSVRLKSNIRSQKGYNIIKRAEKALLNERIRMVNNTITMIGNQINTCMNLLKGILDRDSMEECSTFIKTRREARHIKTQMRQVNKFNWLCHKNRGGYSNPIHGSHGRQAPKQQQMPEEAGQISPNTTITASKTWPKWVLNISSRPLTTAQESLLAHGPNFAVVPRGPPW